MRKIIAIIGLIIMSGGVVYFMTQDEPVQDTPIKDSATQTVTTD